MNNYFKGLTLSLFAAVSMAVSADDHASESVLFVNVNVYDGNSDQLATNTNVLVEGNLIKAVGANLDGGDATVIDGGGRTLMPGLADTHTHIAFGSNPLAQVLMGDKSYNYIHSTKDAEAMLMRGVTFIRDMGGDTFGLKRAIDEGIVPGPRIYPSGGTISQTGGHGDFRLPNQRNPHFQAELPPVYAEGHAYLVDGRAEVLSAARENLRNGASQIKVMVGGGYSSPSDPLRGNQFTFDEIKAAVDAATDWGTYVTVHGYHPDAINRAIDAGIGDVGHGQLLRREDLQRMADEGVFLSTQPFTTCHEDHLDAVSNAKLAEVCEGTATVYEMAKEIPNLKVTYGTDLFFVPEEMMATQVKQMERLLAWYEPADILRMATGTAGELVKMSGPMRDPYLEGSLGVIEAGAYADLLLVDGNPLQDLSAVTDTDNIHVIMKDGVFFKNEL